MPQLANQCTRGDFLACEQWYQLQEDPRTTPRAMSYAQAIEALQARCRAGRQLACADVRRAGESSATSPFVPPSSPAATSAPTAEQALALDCQRGSRTSCDALARLVVGPSGAVPPATPQSRTPSSLGPTASTPARPREADVNAVLAEVAVGTHEVAFHEQRQAGQLSGCGVIFNVGFRDTAYRNGGIVFVRGGVEILNLRPGQLIWTVKIQPTDVVWSEQANDFQIRPFSPSHAWVSVGGFSSAGSEGTQFQCDQGGFCAGGVTNLETLIPSLIDATSIQFGMRRGSGTIDATGRVNVNRNTGDRGERQRFGQCVGNLIERALSQVPPAPSPGPSPPPRGRGIGI